MRVLPVLLAVLSAVAVHAQSFDPGDILSRMGDPWVEVKVDIPPPDSGKVVGKTGDLTWFVPDPEVTRMDVAVRNGVLTQFVATTSEDGREEFLEVVELFEGRAGPPELDGYYSAQQVRDLGAPSDPPLEVALDVDRGVMTVRLAPADS